MNTSELIESIHGHTIVARSDSEQFGDYFVAWNNSCTYRIFHIYDNNIEEVDVWTSDMAFPISSISKRCDYAKEHLDEWKRKLKAGVSQMALSVPMDHVAGCCHCGKPVALVGDDAYAAGRRSVIGDVRDEDEK